MLEQFLRKGRIMQNDFFLNIIKNILISNSFVRFDDFIIRKIGGNEINQELTEKIRHNAFLLFRKKTGNIDFASLPTMRRWFGINGYAEPGREQIYEICFALSLSGEDAEEFLRMGIHEPGVQFNDYQEIIYLYCLENHLSWETAQNLLEQFENSWDSSIQFEQTHSTNQLMKQFSMKKGESTDQFMQWMSVNAASFKGYSKTALDYFNTYHSIIVKYVRMDAAERLDALLKETDFLHWVRKKRILPVKNQGELVRKYIRYVQRRRFMSISEDLLDNIRELNKIANAESDSSQSILSGIFTTGNAYSSVIGNMTGKHLSDLLNLPVQMERAIRAEKALAELKEQKGNLKCPQWIQDFIAEYTKGKEVPDTNAAAKEWLSHFCTEHKRRCRLIQRQDILPMVLYVAQRQYTDKMGENGTEYYQESAKSLFVEMANVTLSSCGMSVLNPDFQLDAILLACFQPEEMYSYEELLDTLERV